VVSSRNNVGGEPLTMALAALPSTLLVAWIALRMAGTILLVPMVEELFFRGYLLERLDQDGKAMQIVALGVSTGLFAVLHERWVLAAIAGLIYGLLYLRRRAVSDAVLAHLASNAVIAAYALITANWSLI
jgi:uncharacterized protein